MTLCGDMTKDSSSESLKTHRISLLLKSYFSWNNLLALNITFPLLFKKKSDCLFFFLSWNKKISLKNITQYKMTCFSNYISKFPFCKWNQRFVFFAKVMALVKVRHINQKEIPIFKNTTYIELKKKILVLF